MPRIALIFFSGSGATALLADAIAEGMRSVGTVTVDPLRIEGAQIEAGRWDVPEIIERLNAADAIVFGTPTYMGGPAAQFKAFADATGGLWRSRAWQGKFAAGFTTSGNPSGDKLSTLTYLSILAGQHGMIWLNWNEMPRQPDGTNHLGSYTGLMGQNPAPPGMPPTLSEADAVSGRRFGAYVASSTLRFGGGPGPNRAGV